MCQPELELSLQLEPHWFPILRSGFHHDFLDGAFLQPCRSSLQFGDRGTKPTTLELQFPVSGICNYNCQHSLVYVDAGHIIGCVVHPPPPRPCSGERTYDLSTAPSHATAGPQSAHTHRLNLTFHIKHHHGL